MPRSRAERGSALGISSSSMRRGETRRRGAEKQSSAERGCRARHNRLVDEKRPYKQMRRPEAERSGAERHQRFVDGAKRGKMSRRGAEKQCRAERSGDVALGISGSSMRREQTSRRAPTSRAERGCRARHHRLVDEARQDEQTRRLKAEQSIAGMSRSSSAARR